MGAASPLDCVDPFIGADWPGNGLVGPCLPLGIVRLGPDCTPPVDTTGYVSGRSIRHFSHTHVAGTGGGGRYGNIGVMPFLGDLRFSIDAAEPAEERAAPGYYSVRLAPAGIKAELTATSRVGVHRYTFPKAAAANVLIDVGAAVQVANNTPGEWTGASIGGYAEQVSDRELAGRADLRGGWGHQYPYSIYFFARFDRPAERIALASAQGPVPRRSADGPHVRAVAAFGEVEQVGLEVGISHVSVAQARASLESVTGGFDEVRAAAADTWARALGRIRVEGGTDTQRRLFYTQFMRLLTMPTDLGVDDEFPLWRSGVRHFTDFYCLWDSVRNANSLITLFDPELEADLLNCLLDVADRTGWLPDAWIAGHSAMVQGGSSADVLFCEAEAKGLPGIDYERALAQMRKNMTVESPDPWHYGRHLADYNLLGYLSTSVPQSVSRQLEYAYQDWCTGALAGRLGHADVAAECFESSRKVWNLWRDDLHGFAPKLPDGRWVNPFDPEDEGANAFFYEGTSNQWSFSVQHDFAGLVERHGGAEAFVEHLDRFFETGQYYSKETMLHIPYLYAYAGRPDRAAERVSACMEKYFKPTRDGLNDNEDMGAQSAFYMCSAMGLYPVMGQDLYLLTTPVFSRVEIALGRSGHTLVVEAPGAGRDRPYIIGATLNGHPLERAWLRHGEFADGAVLRLETSDKPNDWGRGNLPPSPRCGPVGE